MLHLAIPQAHLALLAGDSADSAMTGDALLARLAEQFRFLGAGLQVSIRNGVVHLEVPAAPDARAGEAARLIDRAAKRAREGDFARAAELYQRVLALNPALPTAHRELAMSLVELGRPEEAKDALIDALRLDPTDAWSFVVLGNIYARQSDGLGRARAFFERALALKPADAWALNGLATMLARASDTAAALRHFDEAIAAQPAFTQAWLGKAVTLSRTGESAPAAATVRAMFAYAATTAPDARNEADPGDPVATTEEPTREGTSNPALLRAKHPTAVAYLLDALQRYARLSAAEVQAITLEAAQLGQEGLDYANAAKNYRLRTLPGEEFSGLQVMCLMFAGFKRVAPELAAGMDLEEPFLTALELFNEREGKS